MSQLDMNYIMKQVAEGNLTVDQVNYIMNTCARFEERIQGYDNGQEPREVSSPGVTHPNNNNIK